MSSNKSPFDKAISVTALEGAATRVLLSERSKRGVKSMFKPFWDSTAEKISERLPSLNLPAGCHRISNVIDSKARDPMYIQEPDIWPKLSWKGTKTVKNLTGVAKEQFCARHLEIFPTESQRKFLEQAFGNSRYIWNKCVDYTREAQGELEDPVNLDEQDMRDKLLPKYQTMNVDDREYFLKATPQDTLVRTIARFVDNRQACVTKYYRGQIKGFTMKLREKKDKKQWICVRKSSLTDLCLNRKFLKNDCKLHMKRRARRWYRRNAMDAETMHPYSDFQISRDGERYYLIVSVKRTPKLNTPDDRIVALDPGSRTFQTFFDSAGFHGKLADGFNVRIRRLLQRLDKKVGINKARHRCEKLRSKISNIVRDMHWKVAKYLTDNYACIIIPIFRTSCMVKRGNRVLGPMGVRVLQALSHYKFRERLKHACAMCNRHLIVVSEAYTTQTCNECGNLQTMGDKKEYICENCELDFDRDYNAAKNILTKTLRHYWD